MIMNTQIHISEALVVVGCRRCGQPNYSFIIEETVMERIDYMRSYCNQPTEDEEYASLYDGHKFVNLLTDETDDLTNDAISNETDPDEQVEDLLEMIQDAFDKASVPFNRRYRDNRVHPWRHTSSASTRGRSSK